MSNQQVSGGNGSGNVSGGSVEIKSVKTIKFGGEDENWREWSRKVLAYFGQQGWTEAILDEKKASESEKNKALNFLVMSLTSRAFAFVQDATSAATVWRELCEEYEPNDDVDVYDIQESFSKCQLKSKKENPLFWFKRLEHLNYRLCSIDAKYKKSDEDLKIHVMVNLPEGEYSDLITTMRKTLKTMPFNEVKKDIKQHWRRLVREEVNDKNDEKETVLNTHQENPKSSGTKFVKRFKGKCSYCGKIGHKRADCFKRKKDEANSNKSKNKGLKCWNCGKFGHVAANCKAPKKEEAENMFVGQILSTEVDGDRTYADVVKNKFPKIPQDYDSIENLFCEEEEESEVKPDEVVSNTIKNQMNVEAINETYRLRNQVRRIGEIYPCDVKPSEKKKIKVESKDLIPKSDLSMNPKVTLKTHWNKFRSTMEDFVEKLEVNEDVSEVINRMNEEYKVICEITYHSLFSTGRGKLSGFDVHQSGYRLKSNEKCRDLGVYVVNEANYLDECGSNVDVDENVNVVGMNVEKWLLDSGSTVHLTNNKTYLRNLTRANTNVTVGTGTSVHAYVKGELMLEQLITRDVITLKDVLYVPSFNQNILSVSKMLKEGYVVHGNKNCLKLIRGNKTISTSTKDQQNMFYLHVKRLEDFDNKSHSRMGVSHGKESVRKSNNIRKCVTCDNVSSRNNYANRNAKTNRCIDTCKPKR